MKQKVCKHKHLIRLKAYKQGDFWLYVRRCIDCGAETSGWTQKEAEEGELKHIRTSAKKSAKKGVRG
jgi:hypothetical protein